MTKACRGASHIDGLDVSRAAKTAHRPRRKEQPSGAASQKEFVVDGGLVSYGPSLRDMFHNAAAHVDKILKGAKPSDIPIEQPTKFELVINLKTAKALAITIPKDMLLRADEVIQ